MTDGTKERLVGKAKLQTMIFKLISQLIFLLVSVSFIYDSINRVESVTQEMRLNTTYSVDICKKVGTKGGPTHVVSSITRGFRGVLTFEKSVR